MKKWLALIGSVALIVTLITPLSSDSRLGQLWEAAADSAVFDRTVSDVSTPQNTIRQSKWSTRASSNSRGFSEWSRTTTLLETDVRNPASIRIGFRTTDNKRHRVSYRYDVWCDGNRSKARETTIRTNASNKWVYVNVYRNNANLGSGCNVWVRASLPWEDTAQLRTRIQVRTLQG